MIESPPSCIREFHLLGTKVTLFSNQELLHYISDVIYADQRCTILSGNMHSLNLAAEMPWMRDYLNQVEVVRLDGVSIRIAAFLFGKQTPPRTTWADFGWQLAAYAAQHGFRLYLLGARPAVIEKAAKRLVERYPNLQLVGYHHGYFDKSPGHIETESVIREINDARANIVVIGFGMPIQERWLCENRTTLAANVVMTGGAVFDYLSGELQRAPTWMTKSGLEWLGRMLIDPKRLWHRYLVGGPLFFWRVMRQRIMNPL